MIFLNLAMRGKELYCDVSHWIKEFAGVAMKNHKGYSRKELISTLTAVL